MTIVCLILLCFSDCHIRLSALVVAYAYHPNAQTIYDVHIKARAPMYHHGKVQTQPSIVPESTIWSYVVQLASAIKAVHEVGQAVRMIDITKVLVTGKNRSVTLKHLVGLPTTSYSRVRISSCGIIDILLYDTRQDITLLQKEDLSMLGRLIFALCCNSVTAEDNAQKALEVLSRNYSADLQNLIHFLTSERGHKVGICSLFFFFVQHLFQNILQVFDMIHVRLPMELDDAQK
jgi:PAB-dependent poly(A)-specific ribonuclease subunit 3